MNQLRLCRQLSGSLEVGPGGVRLHARGLRPDEVRNCTKTHSKLDVDDLNIMPRLCFALMESTFLYLSRLWTMQASIL